VRFLVLYIAGAETVAFYYHRQSTTASIRPPAEWK
jgi:hypothetical protein